VILITYAEACQAVSNQCTTCGHSNSATVDFLSSPGASSHIFCPVSSF